ncbi:hypothetical protein NDU88_005867 [Pleurodeles waltl]|uniref:Uncharacterized protein n=1 Tax=Pleurodeles waltl TaxID=8319 RepID=A0AAV7LMI3_PLEWA|nr:hypothetical protein NDU88_005867 [Pleurodeles waltl]
MWLDFRLTERWVCKNNARRGRGLATDENGHLRIELRALDRISAQAGALHASGSLETAPRNRRTRGPERQQLFARNPATAALLSAEPSTACGRTLRRVGLSLWATANDANLKEAAAAHHHKAARTSARAPGDAALKKRHGSVRVRDSTGARCVDMGCVLVQDRVEFSLELDRTIGTRDSYGINAKGTRVDFGAQL